MFYEQEYTTLFSDGDLEGVLRVHLDKVSAKADSIPKEPFLVSSDQYLVEHIHSKMIGIGVRLA